MGKRLPMTFSEKIHINFRGLLMKTYQYNVSAELDNESKLPIYDDNQIIGNVQRVYSNRLKKLLDRYFDFRYFLVYEVTIAHKSFTVKKIFRRGKLWFEGKYEGEKKKTIITYDNWRVGVPELIILHEDCKIKVEKEIELPSRFYEGEKEIATWHAVYNEEEQSFRVELNIMDDATIQDPSFYIAISQATLFIGA